MMCVKAPSHRFFFFSTFLKKKENMGATTSSIQDSEDPGARAAPSSRGTGRRPKRARGLDDDLMHGPVTQRAFSFFAPDPPGKAGRSKRRRRTRA